jgi:hypothetical protein
MISILNDFIQNCNACTVGAGSSAIIEEDANNKASGSSITLPKGMTVIGYVRNRLDCGESSSGEEEDTGKGDIAIGEEQPASNFPSTPSKNDVVSNNNNNNNNRDNTSTKHPPTTPMSALRKGSNFASSPLLYRRDDSLMDQSHQSSLVSLSGTTVETGTNDETKFTTPTSTPAKGQKKTITDENNNTSSSLINDLSTTTATTITLTPKSPMIELSLAKQVANETQLVNGNLRKTNREMLRNYRTTTTAATTNNSNNSPTFTPPRLALNGDEIELQNMLPPTVLEIMDSILPSNSSNNSSSNSVDIIAAAEAAAASVVVARIHHYKEYQHNNNNTPPPLWTYQIFILNYYIRTNILDYILMIRQHLFNDKIIVAVAILLIATRRGGGWN